MQNKVDLYLNRNDLNLRHFLSDQQYLIPIKTCIYKKNPFPNNYEVYCRVVVSYIQILNLLQFLEYF